MGSVRKVSVPLYAMRWHVNRRTSCLVPAIIFFFSLSYSNYMKAPLKFYTNPFKNKFHSHLFFILLITIFLFWMNYNITNVFFLFHPFFIFLIFQIWFSFFLLLFFFLESFFKLFFSYNFILHGFFSIKFDYRSFFFFLLSFLLWQVF